MEAAPLNAATGLRITEAKNPAAYPAAASPVFPLRAESEIIRLVAPSFCISSTKSFPIILVMEPFLFILAKLAKISVPNVPF